METLAYATEKAALNRHTPASACTLYLRLLLSVQVKRAFCSLLRSRFAMPGRSGLQGFIILGSLYFPVIRIK